ncbi:Uma2 family endonuclease [Rugosimonospora africana]|nr:Uma2 family endonuclease [Rugosimonospora africana]
MTVTDPLIQHGSRPWTIDDLADLPEGNRYELLGGSLLVSPPADNFHCRTSQDLTDVLKRGAPKDLYVAGSGFGVGFPDAGTYYVPDVIVFQRSALGRRAKSVKPADVLLVVEVLSPSNAGRDLVMKRYDYAAARIPQYWIVDQDGQAITVLELDASGQHYEESIVVKAGERLVTDQPFPIDFDPAEVF